MNIKLEGIMEVVKSLAYFLIAGLCEISGGYLMWLWLREDKNLWYGIFGVFVIVLYGIIPTLQPVNNFGRIYAAYGGIFIILSLLWGWKVDNIIPDKFDIIGGFIALIGVLIIQVDLTRDKKILFDRHIAIVLAIIIEEVIVTLIKPIRPSYC